MEEACSTNSDAIRDSAVPLLPLDKPVIQGACRLLALDNSAINKPRDINDIIWSCLKDLQSLKQDSNACMIKVLSQLIAVSKYIELCALYKERKVCKHLCLRASIAIVHQMGKGVYFTCQIHHHELYLLKYHHLPPYKEYTQHGQYSLLNNEAVLHDVHIYLVAQSLSSVTPWTLCYHVNHVILPALEIQAMISEPTAV